MTTRHLDAAMQPVRKVESGDAVTPASLPAGAGQAPAHIDMAPPLA